jgi:hypothetical protein
MPKKKTARPAKSKRSARGEKTTVRGYSEDQQAAATAAREAFAARTPQAVLDTLFTKGAKIGGRKVIPLSIASHCFLEQLGNPSMQAGGIDKMTNQQLMELCVVLTYPLSELVELVDEMIVGENRREWEKWVMLQCECIPLESMYEIGQIIGAVILQASQTMVATAPKKKATRS